MALYDFIAGRIESTKGVLLLVATYYSLLLSVMRSIEHLFGISLQEVPTRLTLACITIGGPLMWSALAALRRNTRTRFSRRHTIWLLFSFTSVLAGVPAVLWSMTLRDLLSVVGVWFPLVWLEILIINRSAAAKTHSIRKEEKIAGAEPRRISVEDHDTK